MELDFNINYKIDNLLKYETTVSMDEVLDNRKKLDLYSKSSLDSDSNLDLNTKSEFDFDFDFDFDQLVAILDQAFLKKLPRTSAWLVKQPVSKNMILAASIYKRGVGLESLDSSLCIHPYGIYNTKSFITQVLFKTLSELKNQFIGSRYVFIIDKNVKDFFRGVSTIQIDISEEKKDISYFKNYLLLVENIIKKDRSLLNKTWLLVGGGVLSDTFGFICYLYGINFIIVPTTLCSMVDASIGGKVGINFLPYGKNQVGRFVFPGFVIICLEFLSSLSDSDIQSGCIEAIKVALLKHRYDLVDGFIDLYKNHKNLGVKNFSSNRYDKLIQEALLIKKEFIEQDPLEVLTIRQALNLGHSTAHVLEELALSSRKFISHGHSVGIGLIVSLKISKLLNLISDKKFKMILDKLKDSSLIIKPDKLYNLLSDEFNSIDNFKNLLSLDKAKLLFSNDKKNTSSDLKQQSVSFTLLTEDSFKIESVSYELISRGWSFYIDNII